MFGSITFLFGVIFVCGVLVGVATAKSCERIGYRIAIVPKEPSHGE